MKGFIRFSTIVIALLILEGVSACKSVPAPVPSLALVFRGIEADDPSLLKLLFTLEAEGQASSDSVKILSWQALAEGRQAEAAFSLDYTTGKLPQGAISIESSIPLMLKTDVTALAAMGLAPRDNYNITLIIELDYSQVSRKPIPSKRLEVRGLAVFPGVQMPEFIITEIAVLKAELVNTRFRVALKIDNPNPFPIELSAFSYELYGNGRLWADGIEKNIISVNGKSSLTGNLFLIMNFINMKRDLLDQIIRLEDVNYRFSGDAQVNTKVEYLPKFNYGFDLSGYSQVLEK